MGVKAPSFREQFKTGLTVIHIASILPIGETKKIFIEVESPVFESSSGLFTIRRLLMGRIDRRKETR